MDIFYVNPKNLDVNSRHNWEASQWSTQAYLRIATWRLAGLPVAVQIWRQIGLLSFALSEALQSKACKGWSVATEKRKFAVDVKCSINFKQLTKDKVFNHVVHNLNESAI